MRPQKESLLSLLSRLVFVMIFCGLAACTPPSDPSPTDSGMEEMELESMDEDVEPKGEDEHEHEGEHDHEEGVTRIPNDGAVIEIISPQNGAVFDQGEDIVVEVEIEGFTLNEGGSHWHVYVDGVSYGVVTGVTTTQVLRNLEPGDHEITAHLALGSHEELEDGAVIQITIEE